MLLDLDPNREKRLAHLAKFFRMLGSTADTERRKAFQSLVSQMRDDGISWSDIGNVIENEGKNKETDNKYSEAEMQQYAQAVRAEGIEAGIKIGMARAGNGAGNGAGGHLTLPKPAEMAEYCHARLAQMKDDAQRKFVSDIHLITRRGMRLSPGRLGYLASCYIQIGGKV
jgi:hypothetical protein